jgi:excisionase family DNA binding protein
MSGADKLLTVAAAAELLGVSVKTVRRRIASGEISVVRIGRSVRIHPKELQRYTIVNWDFGHARPHQTQ